MIQNSVEVVFFWSKKTNIDILPFLTLRLLVLNMIWVSRESFRFKFNSIYSLSSEFHFKARHRFVFRTETRREFRVLFRCTRSRTILPRLWARATFCRASTYALLTWAHSTFVYTADKSIRETGPDEAAALIPLLRMKFRRQNVNILICLRSTELFGHYSLCHLGRW